MQKVTKEKYFCNDASEVHFNLQKYLYLFPAVAKYKFFDLTRK